MLPFALGCLTIAVIAVIFGLTGIAKAAADVTRVIFGMFLVIAVISFILAALGGGGAT
jgi:uncharacterized membrane protein YtjA (UPF0391 family)